MTQKLVLVGNKWHIANRIAPVALTLKNYEALIGNDPSIRMKLANCKDHGDGRVTCDGFVDDDGALICLVGAENQLTDMPDIENLVYPNEPVIGNIFVCHLENDAGSSGRPIKAFTSAKMAEDWLDRNPDKLGDWKKYTEVELRGRPHQLDNLRLLIPGAY